MKSTVDKIKEYAETINFTVVENSYNSKTKKIQVICQNNHKIEVNYKNWKTAVNKCLKCPLAIAKKERITIEYLQKLFADKGFELLDTEYKNVETKLQYKCKCGEINSSTINNFKKMIYGCFKCARKQSAKNNSLPFEEVVKLFTNKNYTILITENDYENLNSIIKFECDNGHINETKATALKNDNGCSICSGNKKLTYEFVKEQFEKEDFKLISESYVNAKTKMNVKCKNDHDINISYDDFTQSNGNSKGCIYCAGSVRHKYDDVKKSFEDEKYVLISEEYINAHTRLDFICPKGHEHYISYTHFLSGKRCGICSESKGEMQIRKYIENCEKITTYASEKRFDDCKNLKLLPFDFYVNNHFLIEYDGIQHFEFTKDDFFGGENAFKQRLHHDKIKTYYCYENKIPLLRISYDCFDKISEIIEKFMKDIKVNKSLISYSNPTLYKSTTTCFIEQNKDEEDEEKLVKTKSKKPKETEETPIKTKSKKVEEETPIKTKSKILKDDDDDEEKLVKIKSKKAKEAEENPIKTKSKKAEEEVEESTKIKLKKKPPSTNKLEK